MKIGIISDVHGDSGALNRALAHFDADLEIALTLNAGDLVGRGPAQDEVVETIRARRIPSVCGNHDECEYPLRAEHLAYLHGLPLNWRERLGGQRIFMCHGKPGNNLWGLYRDHASDALLEMMLAGLQADVLVTGHTHMPLCVRVSGGIVVNPGSLYTFTSARSSSRKLWRVGSGGDVFHGLFSRDGLSSKRNERHGRRILVASAHSRRRQRLAPNHPRGPEPHSCHNSRTRASGSSCTSAPSLPLIVSAAQRALSIASSTASAAASNKGFMW